MKPKRKKHDIIVIGASAGGVRALQGLMAHLPASLPAAVLVVVHVGASSHLAQILGRAGALPVSDARSGAPIEPGHVYVAVPGAHLLVHDGHILLRRGPRENMARPGIDPLFRSAACSFGSRVVGVVLSGGLNDGTAGLRAVKRCGGIAVVQDPEDAAVSDMPRSALHHVDVDHCVPIAAMGDLLARLADEPAGTTPDIPMELRLETAIAAQELAGMDIEDRLGAASRFTCPECHGTLWEIADGSMLRYRCHVGHAFTSDAMLVAQIDEAERILWSLLRAHEERAELARRVAQRERDFGSSDLAEQFADRAREYEEDAELVRRLLRERSHGDDVRLAASSEVRTPDAEQQG